MTLGVGSLLNQKSPTLKMPRIRYEIITWNGTTIGVAIVEEIFFGEAKLSIDREHILPKGNQNYRHLSFTMWNLGASCKRCNMLYKGTDEGFIVAGQQSSNLNSSGCYYFIHPNFDLFKDHLGRRSEEVNDTTIVKYTVQNGSEKGEYTYDYFDLKGLEIGSFDTAQSHKSGFAIGNLGVKVRSLAQRFFRPA